MKYYITALVALFILWQILAYVINKPYLPLFTDVVIYMAEDAQILLRNLVATLARVFISVAIALVIGFVGGLAATWLSERVSANLLRAAILLTYPIPHVALLPILLHLFGIETSKIVLMSLIAFYPIALSVMEWTQRFPRDLATLIHIMGGGRRDIVKYVVMPSALPGILTGLKIAFNTAYSVSFIAESLALTDGLGALIYDSWHRLDYLQMYAAILTLSGAGVATYALMSLLERKLIKWA
ncbi:binding-protein-dependent transport systems inner membrane component [Pyrobaculum islandicum DSM 4184]|uniref:Binding-protein-dependent transport systems inner membrane component n=1 Tax=Pyrobaculum islandicum (strain DSM 4184 / JCM 9189 / GEO3) TaxID=384616 RepID=A1RUX6_PYRIL|nr:ABC transporter permease subunit [Pyrobaculum islandicum]ABL88758.1 binding-protein-dependent transport systems inner membrane component [Pyrobaculum islandicum DSM 4184]